MVYRRFRDWARLEVFERIFNALSEEPDMEMAMIDGTFVKVHRPHLGDCRQSPAGQRARAQNG